MNFVLAVIIHYLRKVLERTFDLNVSLCCINCSLRYYHDDEDVQKDYELQNYLDKLSTDGSGIGGVSILISPMPLFEIP